MDMAGGALEAAIEAREQGFTRFNGVTGHGGDHSRYASAEFGALCL